MEKSKEQTTTKRHDNLDLITIGRKDVETTTKRHDITIQNMLDLITISKYKRKVVASDIHSSNEKHNIPIESKKVSKYRKQEEHGPKKFIKP